MKQNQEMLEHAPYHKLILTLSVPTIIIMLVMVIYNMADTFFIGQTGDPDKIAAISLCAPVFSILSGIGTLLGSGGCTSISLALGKKENDKIKAISSFCATGSVILGVVFMAFVLLFTPQICRFLGSDSDTLDFTMSYLRIIAIGAPFILFNNIFTNIIRADGAVAQSMISNLIGTFLNIGLDAFFILVLKLGVTGAAVATVLGNLAGDAYLLYYILRKQPALSLNPRSIRLKAEIILPLFTLGIPMACSTLLMSFSNILSNNLMVSYGNIALASQGIAGKVGTLINMTLMGICMGFGPAISYNYGAGHLKRMYEIVRKTAIFAVTAGLTMSILCFFFRNQIVTAFIDNEEVIAHAQIFVFASLITGPFYGLYQICQTFLQSTGKASYATLVSLLEKGIVFVPVLYTLNHFFGMYGIIFTGCVSLGVSLIVAIVLSIRWNHKLHSR